MRQDRDHVHNVKHYRINQLDNNWFYIHYNRTFSTLTQLVDYYSRKLIWQKQQQQNCSVLVLQPTKDSPLHFSDDKYNIWMLK